MVEALLWLALLSPLQLVLLGHSANQVIGNLSLLGLMLLRMGRRVGEWGSCEWGSLSRVERVESREMGSSVERVERVDRERGRAEEGNREIGM